MKTLRILLADDHAIVREGLRHILEDQSGWKVCGEACDGIEAVKQAKKLKPDVVIMDVSMPRFDGVKATRSIRSAAPKSEVLVLTMHEPEELLEGILEAGARGFILKTDASRELVTAVETLAAHKPFLSSSALEAAMNKFRRARQGKQRKPRETGLTPREAQVVRLLAQGGTNKEVAKALAISVRTAETHRTNVMRKLDFHSITELTRFAIRNRLLDP